jgi:hypothetical protein
MKYMPKERLPQDLWLIKFNSEGMKITSCSPLRNRPALAQFQAGVNVYISYITVLYRVKESEKIRFLGPPYM